ncbi:MAG: hypothetical protein LBL84_00285 [Candidatus Nomurabacteria bacterium]|jgi:hypothetical protein|nr:hypothetical protein [Candidatus Nomurabacteria bacterium]
MKRLALAAAGILAGAAVYGAVLVLPALANDTELKVIVDGVSNPPDVTILSPTPDSTVGSSKFGLTLQLKNSERVVVYDNGKLIYDGPVSYAAVSEQTIWLNLSAMGKHELQVVSYIGAQHSPVRSMTIYYWPSAPNTGGLKIGGVVMSEQSLTVVVLLVCVILFSLVVLNNRRKEDKKQASKSKASQSKTAKSKTSRAKSKTNQPKNQAKRRANARTAAKV